MARGNMVANIENQYKYESYSSLINKANYHINVIKSTILDGDDFRTRATTAVGAFLHVHQ